ncbi:MAG: hypothetical protein ABSB22_12465 [Thermodesulfobacteriota bacterium]|jgi:hypothetical protein
MVKIRFLIMAVIAAGIVVLAIFYLFPSEEMKVKKQFHLLSEWVSKDPGENVFTTARKTQRIGSLFAEKLELKTEIDSMSGSYSPEEISSLAARGRLMFSSLSLKFYDFDISFPENGIAKVILTATLKGRSTTGEYVDETHEPECILRKIERRWLFSNVEIGEVLKK